MYKNYTHLSRKPLYSPLAYDINYQQLYSIGFNAGGRPEGFWIAPGKKWLDFAEKLDNPEFPPCCYLYDVTINPEHILFIRTKQDFIDFDTRFPSYWLNMDYYDFRFDYEEKAPANEYNSSRILVSRGRRRNSEFDLKKLSSADKEALIEAGVIFPTGAAAKAGSQFYSKMLPAEIERFKYKDWDAIAEKYQGIYFANYGRNDKYQNMYLWYQSLDITSGCIWNTGAIVSLRLHYIKKTPNKWMSIQ